MSNLTGIDPPDVTTGLAVQVYYQTFDDGLVLHQFRPRGRSARLDAIDSEGQA